LAVRSGAVKPHSHSKTGYVALVTLGLVSLLGAQNAPPPAAPGQGSPSPEQAITIPDGTPVEMRFAQPVRGKMIDPVDVGTEAQPGNTVRLVAAADVRIGELVVIAEGAVAQATVTTVKRPLTTLVATGLGLQLDWVEDVTGTHVLLRVSPKGEPQPFMVQVLSTPGGVIARPETLRGDVAGKNAVDFSLLWRARLYVPAGTRITAYVYGSPALDRARVEEAQASFYQFQSTVVDVTIYRTKGHGHERPRVLCDGNLGRQIGEREFMHLNMSAGKHSCQIENQTPKEITVEGGHEYYLHLQRSGSSWELKQVTVGEGEDSIEDADPAPKF
jgi:hypothetical protein